MLSCASALSGSCLAGTGSRASPAAQQFKQAIHSHFQRPVTAECSHVSSWYHTQASCLRVVACDSSLGVPGGGASGLHHAKALGKGHVHMAVSCGICLESIAEAGELDSCNHR